MSQENVDVVRALVDAAQRGDWQMISDRYHPDVQFETVGMPETVRSSGRDAIWEYFSQWFGAWDQLQITLEEIIEVDENVVVVVTRLAGIGKESGVATSMRTADVLTLRDRKIIRLVAHGSVVGDALHAVGLRERAAGHDKATTGIEPV
jgi:ketosteroid isomerase-like protein